MKDDIREEFSSCCCRGSQLPLSDQDIILGENDAIFDTRKDLLWLKSGGCGGVGLAAPQLDI